MPVKDSKTDSIYVIADRCSGKDFVIKSYVDTGDLWPELQPAFKWSAIKKVIFNGNCTIVLWEDGTKTVVRAQDDEVFDKEKGLAMAIAKKYFGNKGSYYNNIKKWVEPESEK